MTTTNHYQSLPGSGGAPAAITTTAPVRPDRAEGVGSDCGVAHGDVGCPPEGESLPTTTALPIATNENPAGPTGCITRPVNGCWPWTVRVSKSGKRGEVIGPDGRYRGAMTVHAATALVQELNGLDPRVDHVAYRAYRAAKEAAR